MESECFIFRFSIVGGASEAGTEKTLCPKSYIYVTYEDFASQTERPKVYSCRGVLLKETITVCTRNGLASVYYRLRKDWGMEKVLKADRHGANGAGKVVERAAHFQKDFLRGIGYSD